MFRGPEERHDMFTVLLMTMSTIPPILGAPKTPSLRGSVFTDLLKNMMTLKPILGVPSLRNFMLALLLVTLMTLQPTQASHNTPSLRPSIAGGLNNCVLQGFNNDQKSAMNECIMRCLKDHCCRSLSISPECDISYVYTENLHFVKQVTSAPSFSECSMLSSLGGQGGVLQEMAESFLEKPTPIVQLEAHTFSVNNELAGLKVRFEGGQEVSLMSWSTGASSVQPLCQLAAGERITTVRVASEYKWVISTVVVTGLELHTSRHQTCGPYGAMKDTIEEVTGNQLIYVNSKLYVAIDSLELYFDH